MSLQITFTVEEINALLQVLGQLPTSSGVYPLLLNISNVCGKAKRHFNGITVQ